MMHRFPKQGDREPWINPQNYTRDKKMIRFGPLEDGALIFSNPPRPATRTDSDDWQMRDRAEDARPSLMG